MHYLGPGRPLTSLATWDDIVAAAEGGLLGENQWCELKQMIPPSNKNTNLELARDLASLSVYGGVLIVGVTDKSHEVMGIELEHIEALRSRISQVAQTTVNPPLSPIVHDPVEGPDGRAVLLVSLPPSAVAPHMVDDRYWGRSSDGKRVLAEPEVRQLILSRAPSEEDFLSRLRGMTERDPLDAFIEGAPTGQGHLYLRAEPLAPMPPLPDDLEVRDIVSAWGKGTSGWSGTLSDCDTKAHDPEGRALTSGRGVFPAEHEYDLCHFSIKETDSSIEVVQGGATAEWQPPQGETEHLILDDLVVLIVRQALAAVREFSHRVGYFGQWRIGVHLTQLRGKKRNSEGSTRNYPKFAANTYTRLSITHAAELNERPGTVAERLLRGFMRGLGADNWSLDEG